MDTNDIEVIERYDWSGGYYEWSSAEIGKDSLDRYFFRYGSGCSCNYIDEEDWEPLRDMNQVRSGLETLSFETSDIPEKVKFLARAQGILFSRGVKTSNVEPNKEILSQLDEVLTHWAELNMKYETLYREHLNCQIYKKANERDLIRIKELEAENERIRQSIIDYRGKYILTEEFLAKEGYRRLYPGFWAKGDERNDS